jgi:Beta protein
MTEQKKSSRPQRQRKEPKPTKTALRIARAQEVVPHVGLTFGYKHYLFIAKLKRGEIWALNFLKSASKTTVTPVFEATLPDSAKPPKKPKTLVQHATDSFERVATEWTGLPFYLDPLYLGPKDAPPTPQNAQTVFSIAQSMNLTMIPVTSPYLPQPVQGVIRSVIAADNRGVMFRLTADFFSPPQNVSAYLTGLMAALNVTPEKVDILVDLGYKASVTDVQVMGAYCLANLPNVGSWRTITLGSGCFPDQITKEPMDKWIPFNRSDWLGWYAIAAQRASAGERIPTFADYGVRCGGRPGPPPPRGPSPNLRYSAADKIWVRRGKGNPGMMRDICADLIRRPFFAGAPFSEGDKEIALKAANPASTNAQAEQWIQWCTNHHLELCTWQIQNLP